MQPMFMTTDELNAGLGREDLVIIDVRPKMAFMVQGHLPGAVSVAWPDFRDPDSSIKGLLDPDLGRLARKLGALGISREREVVVYTDPLDTWGDEGRLYWMLRYLGHPRVRILDGGWPKWSAEGRRVERGLSAPRPAVFTAQVDPSLIIAKDELRAIVAGPHPEVVIADARSPQEYAGTPQRGIARGGHIPSAVNIPWDQFVNADGTVKSPEQIQAIVQQQGLTAEKAVICYCTGGVRSAWLYCVLKRAGYEHVKNYPGSWWEWGNDPELPVATPKG